MMTTVSTTIAGKQITIETGRLAKQADGSVLVTCGNNSVLVTAVSAKDPKPGQGFFPLTVEFIEKFYAIGKIPGGYFKREGKPSNESVLSARIIDRPIRPLFPEGYLNDTQVVATILSADGSVSMDVLASVGASAALHISNIPFSGPTAACHVARVDGQFVALPTPEQLAKSDMDILVSGTKNGILMVEGEAKFISEADALAALKFGHNTLIALLQIQDELREKTGSKQKRDFKPAVIDSDFRAQAESVMKPLVEKALSMKIKQERYAGFAAAMTEVSTQVLSKITDDKLKSQRSSEAKSIFEDLQYKVARSMILDKGHRIDGRDLKTVRAISSEVGLLPRAHGSGLFTRGETQCLGTVTLGTADDEQSIETLNGTFKKKFLLHYNFPPYSVGEVGRFGGQGRREIGHGNLAERAVKAVLPDFASFPYTIRVVGEVLESNGSSSMGTVCAAVLALLDAGVKIKHNVAGIAMGLIKESDRVAVLSDILGDEDHLGDMDFKVAGTTTGITALQMDIKIDSVSFQVMETALNQAREGRLHILNEMEKVMKAPRGQLSEFAPRIETIKIRPDKIREVIGSGGKVIRGITEQTGVKIEIQDDGTINIASSDPLATKRAIEIIQGICAEAEVGKVYKGKVIKIAEFGAFVEILPNTQGLLHISELANERVRLVTDVLNEGDVVDVKVLEVDRAGRIKLSRKALIQQQ